MPRSDANALPADAFVRSAALLGEEAMARLAAARVLLVGVGGVGGWCAEALVRTGLGHLVLMDDDAVAPSNLNRQCLATTKTLGRPKVEAMRERLLAINPDCDIVVLPVRYPFPTSQLLNFSTPQLPNFSTSQLSLILDAIDSVDSKARLVLDATNAGIPIVSSMGAALRIDPTRVRVTRFEKVEGDGLARALRQRFRKLGEFPKRFDCVWSDERPIASSERGSIMPVTAAFGMALAAEAIKLLRSAPANRELRTANRESRIVVSLGSNIEPRADYLARARAALAAFPETTIVAASPVEETDPVGVPPEFAACRFLNQVLLLDTKLDPYDFSARMHRVEDELGRVRTVRNGPRTIDIDLIDFDGIVLNDPELTLPHPRARERDFVMRPWRELLDRHISRQEAGNMI